MDRVARLKRLHFRATHRGTKEADILIGGFAARHAAAWNEADMDWFEALLEEQDADIMAWAIGAAAVPPHWHGPLMDSLKRLDYIEIKG